MSADDIQSLIDSVSPGGTLRLEPPKGELEGPVVIRSPITIEGQGATIWAKKGPVLSIQEDGVVLEDLNVAITGSERKLSGQEACALVIRRGLGVTLNDVTVRGNVDGLEEEEGEWDYPRSLRLGAIRGGQRHEFRVKLLAAVPCRIVSEIAGLAVEPKGIKGGLCETTLRIDPLSAGTRIRGDIRIRTAFVTRLIRLTGNASEDSNATLGEGQFIWETSQKPGPPRPVAGFSATPTRGEAPLSVSFTDESKGDIAAWQWEFGDGTVGRDQNPEHEYTSPGTYAVKLIVTGPGGKAAHTQTDAVVVAAPKLVARLAANPVSGEAPLTVAFSDQSVGAVGSWSWKFGDGGTSREQNPTHEYTSPGVYTVKLTVTGPGGTASHTETDAITVAVPKPMARFKAAPTNGEAPLSVSFTDQSTGAIAARSWDFGDGGARCEQNPTHEYTSPGTYTVKLTVTSPGGMASHTATDAITVAAPKPAARFEADPPTGHAPLTVTFTDKSQGPITSWSWDFGDGDTSSARNPTHKFPARKKLTKYTVKLTVHGPNGSDSHTKIIIVHPPKKPGPGKGFDPQENGTAATSGAPADSAAVGERGVGRGGIDPLWTTRTRDASVADHGLMPQARPESGKQRDLQEPEGAAPERPKKATKRSLRRTGEIVGPFGNAPEHD